MSTPRKSNILVSVVDSEAFGKTARAQVGDKLPPEATLRIVSGLAFVKTAKGTFFFDGDGIGPDKPIEKKPVVVCLTRSDIMAIMPCFETKLKTKDVAKLPVLPQKINLAAYIRKFGSRLEANFDLWNNHLSKCQPAPEHLEAPVV